MGDFKMPAGGRVADAFEEREMPDMTALESRAEVDSLEALQAERRKLIEEIGPLELLFGSGGDRWTAKRKQHRDGIAKLVRDSMYDRWRNAGAKGEWKEPSEALLERMANHDERHLALVEKTEATFPRWLTLKTQLTEIEEKIRSRELGLTIYNAELRMAR